MRFYYLCRNEDVSHTSGTGYVAEIAEFEDGTVAVRWLANNASGVASTTIFNSLSDLLKVHGHEGRTIAEPARDPTADKLEERLREAIALLEQNGIAVPARLHEFPGDTY